MRSDLIFGALAHVRNRYELCQLASKATRKLHKPTTRLQDTANEVLVRFHENNPMNAGSQTSSFELHEAPPASPRGLSAALPSPLARN